MKTIFTTMEKSIMGSLKQKVLNLFNGRWFQLLPAFVFYAGYQLMIFLGRKDLDKVREKLELYLDNEVERILKMGVFTKTKRPCVIAMVGLPQVGKTTVADALANRIGFVRINSNDIRAMLIDAGLNYKHVDAIVLSALVQTLKEGFNVILDSDNALPRKWAFVLGLTRHHKGEAFRVQVTCGNQVWFKRLRANIASGRLHRMYADGIRYAKEAYRDPSVPIPSQELEMLVIAEYAHQSPVHKNYAQNYHDRFETEKDLQELLREVDALSLGYLLDLGTSDTQEALMRQ